MNQSFDCSVYVNVLSLVQDLEIGDRSLTKIRGSLPIVSKLRFLLADLFGKHIRPPNATRKRNQALILVEFSRVGNLFTLKFSNL